MVDIIGGSFYGEGGGWGNGIAAGVGEEDIMPQSFQEQQLRPHLLNFHWFHKISQSQTVGRQSKH